MIRWKIITSASFGFSLKILSQMVKEIWQFCDLGGVRLECGGVRDPLMLIKVKKNLHELFLHQNTPFKTVGENYIDKRFF